jgi:hypothetical protein
MIPFQQALATCGMRFPPRRNTSEIAAAANRSAAGMLAKSGIS